jgi:enolase
MAARIASVDALEILDSRGNPTVRVVIELDDGGCVQASVPSGASTGEHEAIELRDGDRNRYGGKGTLWAVENVRRLIGPQIVGLDPTYQAEIDGRLIDLDGTEGKCHRRIRRRPKVQPGYDGALSPLARQGAEIFHALKSLLRERGYATSVGVEGGFAPELKSNEERRRS